LKATGLLQVFEKPADWALLFHFTMMKTCTHLYLSNWSPQRWRS